MTYIFSPRLRATRTISSAPTEGPPDPKHTRHIFLKPNREGMEYLIEGFVPDLVGPGQLNKRERQPLTQNWDMASTEDEQ